MLRDGDNIVKARKQQTERGGGGGRQPLRESCL